MRKKCFSVLFSMLFVSAMTLSGCGSSGGGSTPGNQTNPLAKTLSGTAAAGAPIIGTVTVKGALGNTKSALIEANGNYSVDVSGLTAPYRLRASGRVGGRTIKLHSYAEAADVGGNINITPFTDLIVANAAQQIASAFFDSSTTTELDPAVVDAQETALQEKLQDVFSALGVDTAIDLLNTTFSADRSGLDAALDIIRVSVDATTNVATITNLIESTSITDSITDDTQDAAGTLTVNSAAALTAGVTDIQAIAASFAKLEAAFAGGLPTQAAIQDLFAADFLIEDGNKGLFLTEITTDPVLVGLMFGGLSVSNLDSTAGTAEVTFTFGVNGIMEHAPETWFAKKDATLAWQMRGDQRIVDANFSFHCNDSDGNGPGAGACGINTSFFDDNFTNNGTGGAPIVSGTTEIIDGTSGAVKATVYLGTPAGAAPGFVQVWNEASHIFEGDWKAFGTVAGTINPALFAAGDTIRYKVYTEALDISNPSAPQIAAGATPVATYTDPLLFAPTTTPKLPSLTADTQTAMANFTLGNNLTLEWTFAAGTRNSEVLVMVSDSMGNRIEQWVDTFFTTSTTTTLASTALDSAAATAAGLDANAATYSLLVRIYASDTVTGQAHSRDYTVPIPGPAAP